ncbi:hypothetical protein [Chryseobacterium sp. BIGb0232]|uniref:hypothetical protein n=1 Tax=Chryseobacterium sp. BIGb0232 TaxID=2940598 RepID=UPI000F46B4CF|nr:hypothetical protein [Chryseobacterium sp. BIGb0232]MCS4304507.1 hypothetical protein [Chryseobacterium sp. BIGb0232]ROS14357.1 hypothetical protein EDF65_3131 [Chryseobacterium nakagawai]
MLKKKLERFLMMQRRNWMNTSKLNESRFKIKYKNISMRMLRLEVLVFQTVVIFLLIFLETFRDKNLVLKLLKRLFLFLINKGIQARWLSAAKYEGGISTNLKSFQLTILGINYLEMAVLNTPIGRIVKKNGFTKVSVDDWDVFLI